MRDSDSSTYEKTAGWEKEYINSFMKEAKSGKYDFIFVCQTESVIDEMDRQKIPYVIVEPDNIVWNEQESKERAKERQIIKQQWFGRFILRDNSHIKNFSKWLNHMKDIYDERTGLGFILTPPTIEIVGFLGGAARFIAKPCLKQRVMRFPTKSHGCGFP